MEPLLGPSVVLRGELAKLSEPCVFRDTASPELGY